MPSVKDATVVCKRLGLYRLRARNLRLGVYSDVCEGFFGLRRKFDQTFVDFEKIYTSEGGTAIALQDIGESLPPVELDFNNTVFKNWLEEMESKHSELHLAVRDGVREGFIPLENFGKLMEKAAEVASRLPARKKTP